MEALAISSVALWFMVLLEALAILALVRQVGLIHRRIPPAGARMDQTGPEIGRQLEPVTVTDLEGRERRLGGPGTARRLLVFVAPNCRDCADLAPGLRSVSKSDGRETEIEIVSIDGDPESNIAFAERNGLRELPFMVAPRAGLAYGVSSTPYALLLDAGGILINKGVVNHLEHLESLLDYDERLAGTP